MHKQIFINLPVKDLKASVKFFTALGYTFNAQFTDETGTCMILGENLFAMLLTHEKFTTFSPHPVADAKKSTEVLIALPLDSRAAVDEIFDKAIAAGGKKFTEPQDHGFMYSQDFQDIDGHVWEIFWMDMALVPKN